MTLFYSIVILRHLYLQQSQPLRQSQSTHRYSILILKCRDCAGGGAGGGGGAVAEEEISLVRKGVKLQSTLEKLEKVNAGTADIKSFFFLLLTLCYCRLMSSIVKIIELRTSERKLMREVISVCKLILVPVGKSGNKCICWKIVFHCPKIAQQWHKSDLPTWQTRKVSCRPCKPIFSDRNDNRRRNFGTFESDQQ